MKVFPTLATAKKWLAENPDYEIAKNRGGFLVWVRKKP